MPTAMDRWPPAGRPEPTALKDFDRVRLMADILIGGKPCPKGSVGTIVHSYRGGAAFEVEFTSPAQGVATLQAAQIAAVSG